MSEPQRYVHVGFPKSASSSLQNFYFGVHPDCLHLGLGFESKGNTYFDEGVERVSEVDIRLKKEFLWDLEACQKLMQPAFDHARENNFKAVGISNEFHSFALGNEVDTADKARRLRQLFGDGTKAIIVIREQFSFLKSLYLELLKGGYGGTYRKYLEYTYLYQVRSWCTDICYDNMYNLYVNEFGKENVCMVVFEQLKKDPAAFLTTIANSIGISTDIQEMRAVNTQAESMGWYEQLRRYNEKFPREFGTKFFEPFNMNRMRAYFHNEMGVAVPHDRLADDMLRMPINQAAQKISEISPVSDLSLKIPEGLETRMTEMFSASNRRLQDLAGFDLEQYGYRL